MIDFLKNLLGFGPSVDYKALVENGAKIIDVRNPSEFKGGHVKGAINIPLPTISANVTKIKKMNVPIVVCCVSGMRSGQAKRTLKREGIEVYNAGAWQNLK